MKLQLALDVDLKKSLKICKEVKNYIDIIELGTPLIKKEGLGIIRKFKKFRKIILADLKTMDVGFLEAEMAFKSGADIATVCGSSYLDTISGAISAGRKYRKKVLVDLINIDSCKEIKKIIKLKPNYIGIHTGIDMQKQGKTPFKDLKKLSKMVSSKKIAVAGGINEKTVSKIAEYNPEIIVIGGAITNSKNPLKVVKKLKEVLNEFNYKRN